MSAGLLSAGLLSASLLSAGLVATVHLAQVASAKHHANRYLELRSMTGMVIYQNAGRRLRAWPGLRLRAAGELLETDKNSGATLSIDDQLGVITISENTKLLVRNLAVSSRGGYVTQLEVLRGQANLKSSHFVNPDSRLELYTPTGIVGVRGTEFGIAIQPTGRTGVAALSGKVAVSAQDQSVLVRQREQSLVSPKEPPQPPRPLNNEPSLSLELSQRSQDSMQLTGRIDPSHLLSLNGAPKATDRDGSFTMRRVITTPVRITLRVTTPLGEYRTYEIPLQ